MLEEEQKIEGDGVEDLVDELLRVENTDEDLTKNQDSLLSLLEDEDNVEKNLGLIYRHISFRATKILSSNSKFSQL
jgi:hypothetical protein